MSNVNEQAYEKIADQFLSNRQKLEVNELVIEFADHLKMGDRVLDVGCGAGVPIPKYLVKKGLKVTGIDISSKLLDRARQNVPSGEFLKADILYYRSEESFPGIVAWDSLFHLQFSEHERAFKKISGLLKNNGYFVFTHGGGSGGEITGEMYGERFYYSTLGPEKTKKLLTSLGFRIARWEIDYKDNGYMMALVQKSNNSNI